MDYSWSRCTFGIYYGIPTVDQFMICFATPKAMDVLSHVQTIQFVVDIANEHVQFHVGYGDVNLHDYDSAGHRFAPTKFHFEDTTPDYVCSHTIKFILRA